MCYQYSSTIVSNNLPWPTPTDAQKAKIEQTAQAILDARALYPDASLADLYNELTMPPELRTAHQQNDRAVMQAYGFSVRDMTESSCVAALMKMYQQLTEQKGICFQKEHSLWSALFWQLYLTNWQVWIILYSAKGIKKLL